MRPAFPSGPSGIDPSGIDQSGPIPTSADCPGYGSCLIASRHFSEGNMLGIPRRAGSAILLWHHSVRPYLRDGGGNREYPLHRNGDLRRSLAAIVVCRLDHDVADRAVCSTGHSKLDARLDARRLNSVAHPPSLGTRLPAPARTSEAPTETLIELSQLHAKRLAEPNGSLSSWVKAALALSDETSERPAILPADAADCTPAQQKILEALRQRLAIFSGAVMAEEHDRL
jgi:hypothetical protein